MEIPARLAVVMITLLHLSPVSPTGNDLRLLDGCICPNHNISFQCTTVGGGITVWQGSAFQCPQSSNEIALRHSQFLGSVGVCNDGAICAHAVSIQSTDCFVSNLTVNITPDLEGRSVRCEHDNGHNMVVVVRSFTLNITRGPLPGPLNVILADASPHRLTFSWTPISNSCQVQSYDISSSNCGVCPNRTNLTTVYCTGFETSRECTFTVWTVVCDNIVGNEGTDISFMLQVPPPPRIINSTSSYSSNNTLTRIITAFTTTSANATIADTIDGSSSTYTITYSASISGIICDSHTIPASECSGGVCIQEFDVTTSSCFPSTDVSIKVFASNILGNGSSSDPIIKDGTNTFVRVEAQLSSVVCTFLNNVEDGEKSCSLVYGHDCQHLDSERLIGLTQEGNSVTVPLLQNTQAYCYVVTATSGGTSVNVTGSFSTAIEIKQQIVVPLVAVMVVLVATFVLVTSLVMSLLAYRWSRSSSIRVSISHKCHTQRSTKNATPEETGCLIDNQGPCIYTFSELCRTNTIVDSDDSKQDEDAYRQAPQEEYGITLMDLLRLRTDIDNFP